MTKIHADQNRNVRAPVFSVIIVNYNSGGRLERCLQRLEAQSFSSFEIMVIDNASSDASLGAARMRTNVRVIEAGANLGFAAANNKAAKEAKGQWLVFLNPDAYAERDWLVQLANGVERYPWASAFGSCQVNAKDPSRLDGCGDSLSVFGLYYRSRFGWPTESAPGDAECLSPCAAAAAYNRDAFEALGGFDERFFCYGEDIDLGLRLRRLGRKSVQLKDARVHHEGSALTGRASAFTIYHGHRNRIWTLYKNLPRVFYWLTAPLRLIADLALGARLATQPKAFGAYLRSLKDGYGGLHQFADERPATQEDRRNAATALRGLIVWSPLALVKRAGRLRSIEGA